MKRIFALAAAALVSLGSFAQNGGLDPLMLQTIRQRLITRYDPYRSRPKGR